MVDYIEEGRCKEREIASCLEASKSHALSLQSRNASHPELACHPEVTSYTGSTLLANSSADAASNV